MATDEEEEESIVEEEELDSFEVFWRLMVGLLAVLTTVAVVTGVLAQTRWMKADG